MLNLKNNGKCDGLHTLTDDDQSYAFFVDKILRKSEKNVFFVTSKSKTLLGK